VPPHAPTARATAPPALDAEIAIEDDRWCDHPGIEAAAVAAVAGLVAENPAGLKSPSAATIVLSDDARVEALNTQFRHKATPTNVLSFPAGSGASIPGEPTYLGDVIIARETVEGEAADQGIPLIHHVQHLVIHGVLHLLGYDHLSDTDASVMEALETRILTTLGIPDPYADGEPAGAGPVASHHADQ